MENRARLMELGLDRIDDGALRARRAAMYEGRRPISLPEIRPRVRCQPV
jgi:hypothetical protein